MRALTKAEKDLWSAVCSGVKPLLDCPVGPVQGNTYSWPSQPRQTPYSPYMDLHGVTVHEAHGIVINHIENGWQMGYKRLTVITGRSGQINVELPRWVENHRAVRSVTPKNGGGAWEICLKKQTT